MIMDSWKMEFKDMENSNFVRIRRFIIQVSFLLVFYIRLLNPTQRE